MTLPLIGTTVGAQIAHESVGATSTATGTITFTGPSGVQGSVLTCVVTVPNAPAQAVFTATLGAPNGQGIVLDTWGGESTAGKFQINVGQTLVVTGTGLVASTAYTCTFSRVADVGAVQLTIPEPNSSAIIAQTFTQAGVDILYNQVTSVAVGGTNFDVTSLRAYQTIVVTTGLVVAGNTLTCAVTDTTLGALTAGFIGSVTQTRGNAGSGHFSYALPIVNQAGDNLRIRFTGATLANLNILILGVTVPVAIGDTSTDLPHLLNIGTPMRADGRPYPLGNNVANATAAGNLIAAPGAGTSIMLQSVGGYVAGGGAVTISATINGVSNQLIGTAAAAAGVPLILPNLVPPQGILCDVNTAVTMAVTGGVTAIAVYDLVA